MELLGRLDEVCVAEAILIVRGLVSDADEKVSSSALDTWIHIKKYAPKQTPILSVLPQLDIE